MKFEVVIKDGYTLKVCVETGKVIECMLTAN